MSDVEGQGRSCSAENTHTHTAKHANTAAGANNTYFFTPPMQLTHSQSSVHLVITPERSGVEAGTRSTSREIDPKSNLVGESVASVSVAPIEGGPRRRRWWWRGEGRKVEGDVEWSGGEGFGGVNGTVAALVTLELNRARGKLKRRGNEIV